MAKGKYPLYVQLRKVLVYARPHPSRVLLAHVVPASEDQSSLGRAHDVEAGQKRVHPLLCHVLRGPEPAAFGPERGIDGGKSPARGGVDTDTDGNYDDEENSNDVLPTEPAFQ